MTDQPKIPVPPHSAGQRPAKWDSKTMIERAVQSFDMSKLQPPPVPGSLAPARHLRPVARQVAAAPLVREEALAAAANAALDAAPPPLPAAPVRVEGPVFVPRGHHPVDREHLRQSGMIVPEAGVTAGLEEFRIVKRQLLNQSGDLRRQGGGAAAQRVLISSPLPGEGKTYCAVNLALAIAAEKECDVILVDADFAKPSVLSTLGLPGGPGLMDALTDPNADVAQFVIGTDIPGLSVLPSGATTNRDSEYLSASHTRAVLDRLIDGAPNRMVIIDSPPALAASPAAELAKYVGQVLVVVRADTTGQGALDDAISLLSACPNIELLLNAVTFSPSGRRFGNYYGYGG